jgi:hypothetical protein
MASSRAGGPDDEEEMQLRAAVQSAVMQIVKAEEKSQAAGVKTKNSAILSLSELAFLYATKCVGPDLVAFAQHAKKNKSAKAARTRIAAEDVLLVARKNPGGLLDKLQTTIDKRREEVEANAVIDVMSVKHRKKSAKVAQQNESSSSEDAELREAMADVHAHAEKAKPVTTFLPDDSDSSDLDTTTQAKASRTKSPQVKKGAQRPRRRSKVDDVLADSSSEEEVLSAKKKSRASAGGVSTGSPLLSMTRLPPRSASQKSKRKSLNPFVGSSSSDEEMATPSRPSPTADLPTSDEEEDRPSTSRLKEIMENQSSSDSDVA